MLPANCGKEPALSFFQEHPPGSGVEANLLPQTSMSRTHVSLGWGLAWKRARTREQWGRGSEGKNHTSKKMQVQGLGLGTPFPAHPETDRQTGEAGHREDSERWTGDKLKESRQNSSSFPRWDPPLPALTSVTLPTHTSPRPVRDAQGTKDSTEAKEREGRGLRSPCRTLKPVPTCPPALSPPLASPGPVLRSRTLQPPC